MTHVLSAIERNRGMYLLFRHALVGEATLRAGAGGLLIDDLQQGQRIADLAFENPRLEGTDA